MRAATLSAIFSSIALTALSANAVAQITAEPPGRLFFEGDIVSHRVDGQAGPWCVLKSRYTRGEAIAWRVKIFEPDGSVVDDSSVDSVVVELGSGQTIPLDYGPHGNPPQDYFWANSWTVPANHPTGTLGYSVRVTLNDGSVVTWQPFMRTPSQLTIVEGMPAMAAAQ